MSALAAARRYDWQDVLRARVALTRAMLQAGYTGPDVVSTLRRECGVSRPTAFRVLKRARQDQPLTQNGDRS